MNEFNVQNTEAQGRITKVDCKGETRGDICNVWYIIQQEVENKVIAEKTQPERMPSVVVTDYNRLLPT